MSVSHFARIAALLFTCCFPSLVMAQATEFPQHPGPWSYQWTTAYGAMPGFPTEGEAIAQAKIDPRHQEVARSLGCPMQPLAVPDGAFFVTGVQWDQVTGESRDWQFDFWSDVGCGSLWPHGLGMHRTRVLQCPAGAWFNYNIGLCVRTGDPTKHCADPEESEGNTCPYKEGQPVHVRSGEKMQTEKDYQSPSSTLLRFRRYYRSGAHVVASDLGPQWRHTFSRNLAVVRSASTGNPVMAVYAYRHDATRLVFMPNGAGGFNTDVDINARLATITSGGVLTGWRLTRSDESVEVYSADGALQSITGRDGDLVTLTYDTNQRLLEVQDRSGRKLVFSYTLYSLSPGYASRLTQVALPDGQHLRFEYDANMMLAKIRYPDATPGTWTDNPARQYVYGEGTNGTSARLTGIVDELGNRIASWRYEANGRAILSVLGDENSYVGRVEFVHQATVRSTVKVFSSPTTWITRDVDHAGVNMAIKVTAMSQPCPGCNVNLKTATYDSNGNLDLMTDFANTVTDFDHDARNLQTKRVEAKSQGSTTNLPEKRSIETDWHTTFRLPTERRVKNAAGTVETKTSYAYNARGQLVAQSQIDPATSATRTTSYTYCEQADVDAVNTTCPLLGLRKTVDGARTDVSDVTTYAYYGATDETGCAIATGECHRKGDLWKVTNAVGHVSENVRYDRSGRLTRSKDPNGVVTDVEYTVRGWVSRSIVRGTNDAVETDDAITQVEYSATGQVSKVTQPDGVFLTYTYDTAHRLTGIADNVGNTITYTLDGRGNRTKEDTKDPSGVLKRTLSRTYDTLGRLTATKNAANVAIATNVYDANSNADTVLDAKGRTSDSDHDPLNRLKRVIQDVGGIAATTSYAYDARDNLRQVTDPKGLNTLYNYDGLNNQTQLSSPDTGTTTYTHDAAGNRLTQTDARGITSTYTYDALGRLTGIAYPTSSLDVAFAYDTAGSGCTTGSTFAVGRLSTITDQSGSTTYCYDRHGNVTSKKQVTTAPTGSGPRTFLTGYGYTIADRLASITYPDATVASYGRNTLGQITSVQYDGQGLITAATYLPFGPLSGLTYANGHELERSYDQNYWPTGVESDVLAQHYQLDDLGNITALGATAGFSTPTETYAYDGLDRLKEVRDANQALIEGYAYDATGNRTSKTRSGLTEAYGYPATSHRLSSVDSTARGYDANGNWTTQGGATVHQYDERNRRAASTGLAMGYNGRGERVAVNERVFGYDETGKLLYESGDAVVTTPATERRFVWLDDLPVGYIEAVNTYYIHADQLDAPRVVTSTTGVTAWTWSSQGNPFGEVAANRDADGNGSVLAFPLRFPGQYADDGSGVYYNYYRDYEPSVGRYKQSDPLGLVAGVSTYSYTGANPLRFSDSYGLFVCLTTVDCACIKDPKNCATSPAPTPKPAPVFVPVSNPAKTCETCSSKHPEYDECSEVSAQYPYASAAHALADFPSGSKPRPPTPALKGICAMKGVHQTVKLNGGYMGSIFSCNCCTNTGGGPVLSEIWGNNRDR